MTQNDIDIILQMDLDNSDMESISSEGNDCEAQDITLEKPGRTIMFDDPSDASSTFSDLYDSTTQSSKRKKKVSFIVVLVIIWNTGFFLKLKIDRRMKFLQKIF